MRVYIGVDIHPHQQTAAFLSDSGNVRTTTLHHNKDDVRDFYSQFSNATVGIEATGSYRWFENMLFELGHELLIGSAREIRLLVRSRNKNDKLDAKHILELLREDRFPAIWRRPQESNQVLELLRLRHNIVRQRTMCLNRLQSIRIWFGLPKRKSSPPLLAEISGMDLPFSYALSRDVQLSLLGELNSKIADVEKVLADLFRVDRRAQLLNSHFGVGYLTALCFVHTIVDPERFANKRKVVAYLGFDPVEESSADKHRIGEISKCGSKLLRFLLVQSAQAACRRDPELKEFYSRVAGRRGTPKAKIAIARKLAIRLYKMLRYDISYAQLRGEA
ncbi:MAG TPA: IS110 family transposase [Aridibacter sp.]|nr:IS110 family transposase [Aridibacter sp.]